MDITFTFFYRICFVSTATSDECIDSKVFKDTAESQKMWIESMMKQDLCTCDQEHMFECPKKGPPNYINDIGNSKGVESREDFDAIFNSFWDEDDEVGELTYDTMPWLPV